MDTAAELIGHHGPSSRLISSPDEADYLGELQEFREPEPRPAPGYVPVAVGGA